jgi:hypothetical protein
MEFGQHWPRFCALLIDKAAAGFPVEAKCVTWPAAPVESRHLVGDECLIQRVQGQQMAKLPYQVGMPAKLQLALDALQDGRPALLYIKHDGFIGPEASQNVYRDLKTFDPGVQTATVDLTKTVNMTFQQKAAQKYK